jgi:regulator of RNase E activity RraA
MSEQDRSAAALTAEFKDIPTSVISDNLDRMAGPVGPRPLHRSGNFVGIAPTVRTRTGDNRTLHEALEQIGPSQVLVVDGGATRPGPWSVIL